MLEELDQTEKTKQKRTVLKRQDRLGQWQAEKEQSRLRRGVLPPTEELDASPRIKVRPLRESLDFSMAGVDRTLVLLLVGLTLFGVIMVTSTASYSIIRGGQEGIISFMLKQAVFAILGFAALFFTTALDYHRLTWRLVLLAGPVVLLLNILPRFISDPVNGAYRWIYIGSFSFQPSEIAKYYMVFLASGLLAFGLNIGWRAMLKRYVALFISILLFVWVIAGIQSNLSTAGIMVLSSAIVMVMSAIPFLWNLVPGVAGILAGIFLIWRTEYRMQRVFGFLDPFSDPTGNTLQVVQSLYALSMGGLFGRGLGNSRFKAYWLPYAENDFIFAIICEELGLLGGLAVLTAMLALVLLGFRAARRARDAYGRLLAVGIVSVIGFQALINMAVVMGAFPVTGVPLPFISAGGTSLVMNLAAMGVVLNISRQGR